MGIIYKKMGKLKLLLSIFFLLFVSIPIVFSFYCYVETADVPSYCTTNDFGSYTRSGFSADSHDGNWTVGSQFDNGFLVSNYTKPDIYYNDSIWMVKYLDTTTNLTINLTLSDACYNYSTRVVSVRYFQDPNYAYLSCFNGTHYEDINVTYDRGLPARLWEEAFIWKIPSVVTNCSTGMIPTINFSYYTYYNQTYNFYSNFTFSCSIPQLDFNVISNFLMPLQQSSQFCLFSNISNAQCNIESYYDNTNAGVLDYSISYSAINLSDTITYYNLTLPILDIYFSSTTDLQVITVDNEYYYDKADQLIAMTNLSEGKVSVIFNNGTQFYEFYNNQEESYFGNMTVATDLDYYVNLRVQDRTFSILDDATIDIYELGTDNQTKHINRLYGQTGMSIPLDDEKRYKAIASLDGYIAENGFTTFKPTQYLYGTDTLVLTMYQTEDTDMVRVDTNQNYVLTPPKDIIINVSSLEAMSSCIIMWYINDTNVITYTASPLVTQYTAKRTFSVGDEDHQIYVYVNGDLVKTITHTEATLTTHITDLDSVRSSLVAFGVFMMFIVGSALSVQSRFKNYGKETLGVMLLVFSFLSYYILSIAIVTVLGLITKKIVGDNS